MRMQGTQVETFRVIRGETQTRDTEGRASYLKREGKLVFKIKPEMTRQCTKPKVTMEYDNLPANKSTSSFYQLTAKNSTLHPPNTLHL